MYMYINIYPKERSVDTCLSEMIKIKC